MTTTSVADVSSPFPTAPIQNVPVTVDTKGRVRVSKAQRQIILAEFERSGVSATQFAQRTGLKYSTLAGWVQRYVGAKRDEAGSAVRLLEAVVEAAQPLAAVCAGAVARRSARGSGAMKNKRRWRRRWCGHWPSHAKFFRQLEGVRGGGSRATCAKVSTVCTRW